MSRFVIIALFLTLIAATLINAQTYSNCKDIGNGYKVEWTADQTGNKLSARFTIPNSSGWASIGLKSGSTTGMTGATILLATQSTITGEVSCAIFLTPIILHISSHKY